MGGPYPKSFVEEARYSVTIQIPKMNSVYLFVVAEFFKVWLEIELAAPPVKDPCRRPFCCERERQGERERERERERESQTS